VLKTVEALDAGHRLPGRTTARQCGQRLIRLFGFDALDEPFLNKRYIGLLAGEKCQSIAARMRPRNGMLPEPTEIDL